MGECLRQVVFLNARSCGTDATAKGKHFQHLITLHAKLFLLLGVSRFGDEF